VPQPTRPLKKKYMFYSITITAISNTEAIDKKYYINFKLSQVMF